MFVMTYCVRKCKKVVIENLIFILRVLPKNATQCPRPGLEPGPLAPRTSAMRLPLILVSKVENVAYLHPTFVLFLVSNRIDSKRCS